MELKKLKEILEQENKEKDQLVANLNAKIGGINVLQLLIADEEKNLEEIKK